jgi:hypothetical protein
VYLDKDLVLPPMAATGAEETFLVVASTDLERANIMMARIREQVGKVPNLQGTGELEVSASAVPLAGERAAGPLGEQVEQVACAVNEMVRAVLGKTLGPSEKNKG